MQNGPSTNGSSKRRIRSPRVHSPKVDASAPHRSPRADRTDNQFARRVQTVSKRAALASKQKLWDSHAIYDNAAFIAVDVFEESYHTTRSFLLKSISSMKNVYNATKDGVQKIEHHLLVPVRDAVILPAFSGAEHAAELAIDFVQSEEAVAIAANSFQMVKRTPLIGEAILAPVIMYTYSMAKNTWEVIKYPIPSRDNVRNTVDGIMIGTKFVIVQSWKELYFYAKLVDASVTRALSHTQWRVLGFGPYSSLREDHKKDVIDHLCERYLATDGEIARYELACHIKFHNWMLYHDLIVSGLLLERGGSSTKDDWLLNLPEYISEAKDILLVDNDGIVPLWCYIPNKNGEQPHGASWLPFSKKDRLSIEAMFRVQVVNKLRSEVKIATEKTKKSGETKNVDNVFAYPTVAQWYEPNDNDVLIDDKRHAISFQACCRHCRIVIEDNVDDINVDSDEPMNDDLCSDCIIDGLHYDAKGKQLNFPAQALMRPTLWRFHGIGNQVRRGVWLLNTQRNGLQPYNDESASALEEAYSYLIWRAKKGDKDVKDGNPIDHVLLTVQVCFDEETQLVQFRSLNQITAVTKSVAGGLSLFKRRVYRGIHTKSDHVEHSGISNLFDDKEKVPCILAASEETLQTSAIPDSNSENIEHLVLVVHGIGEMLRNEDLLGLPLPALTTSITECCDSLRTNHAKVLESTIDSKQDRTSHQNRKVEYIPIEWHEPFAIQSRGNFSDNNTIKEEATIGDITMDTIPRLRNFANDTMLDILYFMSPIHHHQMVEIVTSELNTVVEKYIKLTGFKGKISILSHSLGSVICWDILSHQKRVSPLINEDQSSLLHCVRSCTFVTTPDTEYEYPSLHFDVVNNFMIGSPVAVFLIMRSQNNLTANKSLQLSGCKRVFNIFHPYDPVAYRLEPLMDKRNKDIEPKIIPHWRFGLRVQYQTKLWLRKIRNETERVKEHAFNAVEASFKGIGLLEGTRYDEADFEDENDSQKRQSGLSMKNGAIYGGERHDYLLQENELENANEYIAALAAHSSYWESKDLTLFIAEQLFGGRKIIDVTQASFSTTVS